MYMLDTNICICVLQNHSDKLRFKFKAIKNICISSVTYAELCYGIENGENSKKEARWKELDNFTQHLLIDPLDEDAAKHYGFIRAWLKKRGTPIGNNDLLIASHARSLNAVLVTNNVKEFSRVPDLTIENWVDE
ncbi:MAG TPA: type II toxin-antitoxin system VapC family toxin [Gammaproteobacteria bacterium]|nr:type II toxin-antitoxin system VapC family toxin [Gammaproteobacteria bacterium]